MDDKDALQLITTTARITTAKNKRITVLEAENEHLKDGWDAAIVDLQEHQAKIVRLREVLKHIVSMAAQDIMLDEYGAHTNQIVLVARAALEPQP